MYQLLRKRLGGKKGFTLIELIVVIAIIAILAVILIPRFAGFTQNARQRAVLSEARNILLALEALDAEGEFPAANVEDEVEDYLGKDLSGTLASASSDADGVDFTYYIDYGDQRYIVTCTDGVLKEKVDITAAPAPSPSGSGT